MGFKYFSDYEPPNRSLATAVKNAYSSLVKSTKGPNPNPFNFKVESVTKINDYFILEVTYPDCTTFEGLKLLVYKGDYPKGNWLDPHFHKEGKLVARFRPDSEGRQLAKLMCETSVLN